MEEVGRMIDGLLGLPGTTLESCSCLLFVVPLNCTEDNMDE